MKLTKIKSESGVASVEIVIVTPFILLMMMGGIDLARTVYQYNTLVKNMRDATKYISSSVRPIKYDDSNTNDPEVEKYITVMAEARNLALCGKTTNCITPSVTDLSLNNIHITYPTSLNGVTFVKMSISDFSLGFISNLFGDSLDLGEISYTMYQLQQS
jgi:Flp pilus assembly protein TadG